MHLTPYPDGSYVKIGVFNDVDVLHISVITIALTFCLAFIGLSKMLFAPLSLRFFTLYLCFEALSFGFEWLLVHPTAPYKAAWLALLMASSFLLAPCVWLFALETNTNSPPSLRRIGPTQWLVIVLGALFTVPLFMVAHSGHLLVDPARPRNIELGFIVHGCMLAAISLYLLQVPWYLRRCWQLFEERGRLNQFIFSDIQEPALHALRSLLWVMAASWGLGLTRTLRAILFDPSAHWNLFFSTAEAAVILWALYAIFQRCWHYNSGEQELVNALTGVETKPSTKYARSALDESARNRILAKLDVLFQQEKIYRNSQLKLQDLSEKTGESSHYLSQVINESKACTFYALVNHYRIAEAKQLLRAESNKTIMEIALEVGFNAKSTFNAAFKADEGITPREYKEASKTTNT